MRLNPPNSAPKIKELTLRLTCPGSLWSLPWNEPEAELSLATLAGQVIVLFVFGIDCGTCRHLAGMLSGMRAEYAPAAEFLGVCVQNACDERLPAFREASGANLPFAHCPTRELCPALGISAATWLFYPTFIFIDQEQRMRGFVVGGSGFFEDTEANLRAAIDGLLREMHLQTREPLEVGA